MDPTAYAKRMALAINSIHEHTERLAKRTGLDLESAQAIASPLAKDPKLKALFQVEAAARLVQQLDARTEAIMGSEFQYHPAPGEEIPGTDNIAPQPGEPSEPMREKDAVATPEPDAAPVIPPGGGVDWVQAEVSAKVSQALHAAGFRTAAAVIDADDEALENVEGVGPATVTKLRRYARKEARRTPQAGDEDS